MSDVVFTTSPGEVILLNYTGGDATVVNAATVSDNYNGVAMNPAKFNRLIESMPKEGHWGCHHHLFVTFLIKCPIFVARHLVRSSGMHLNEISGRYKTLEPLFYIPSEFHTDVKRKELGLAPEVVDGSDIFIGQYKETIIDAWETYEHFLRNGVRKEQARDVLPVSIYTEFWFSGTLRYFLHMLNLRMDPTAQQETREVAGMIYEHLKAVYPETIRYWELYGKGPINEYGTIQTP